MGDNSSASVAHLPSSPALPYDQIPPLPPLPPSTDDTASDNTATTNMNKESTIQLRDGKDAYYIFGRSSSSTSPFPDYIDFNITESLAQDINTRIQSYKSQIHPAMIYSFIEKKTIESQLHRKKSFKKSFRDSSLEEDIFNKQLIPLIESIFSVAYSHLEVHITVGDQHFDYICYESGGYFEKHRDFTRINADSIHQQYTMLIGLTPRSQYQSYAYDCGHTIIWYPIYPGVENYDELMYDYEILTRVRDPKKMSASYNMFTATPEEKEDCDIFHKICTKYHINFDRYNFCQKNVVKSLPMTYQSDDEESDTVATTMESLSVNSGTADSTASSTVETPGTTPGTAHSSLLPSNNMKYLPKYFEAHTMGKCLLFKSSLLHSGEIYHPNYPKNSQQKELLMITINIAALPKATAAPTVTPTTALPIDNTLTAAIPANPMLSANVISKPVVLYDHFQPWMISAVAEHHVIPFQLILIQGSYNDRNICDHFIRYWNFNNDIVPVAANPTSMGLVESMSHCLQELYNLIKNNHHHRGRESFISLEIEEVESRVSETWRQRVENHVRFLPWWNGDEIGSVELKAVHERVQLFILNFKAQFEEENSAAYKETVNITWEESGCNDSGDEYDETTYFDCKIDIKFGFARYSDIATQFG